MTMQSKLLYGQNPAPAPASHNRKPPSEAPKSALFRIISPSGTSRELPLRCGEEAEVLNRRIRLEEVNGAERNPAFSSPPNAVLCITHLDGSGRNNYFVEEGREFPFGDHSFRLVEIR